MSDLKYGDIVEWTTDGCPTRWMIIVGNPTYLTQYEAAWMVRPDEYGHERWEFGQVITIGVHEGTKVIRG